MEDRSKHIDDLFLEELKDYRETPGPHVWNALEQRLPAANVTARRPSGKWLWYLLLLLLLATAGYFIIRKNAESKRSKLINENIENTRASTPQISKNATPIFEEKDTAEKNEAANNKNNFEAHSDKSLKENTNDQEDKNQNNNKQILDNNLLKSNDNKASLNDNTKAPIEEATKKESSKKSILNNSKKENNAGKAYAINQVNAKPTNGSGSKNNRTKQENNVTPKSLKSKSIAEKNSVSKRIEQENNTENKGNKNDSGGPVTLTSEITSTKKTTPKKDKKTIADKKQQQTAGKPTKINSEKGIGKNIQVASPIAKKKNSKFSSATGKKNEIEVQPETFKNKKIIIDAPETFKRTSKIIINSNEPKKTIQQTVKPSVEPKKKTYEVTNSGVKIYTEDGDEPVIQEETNDEEIIEPKEETVADATPKVLLATGTEPAPVAPPASGGGGASEPNVPLRNFNKLKFEAGIKAGYERGTNQLTTNNFIIAPFLQWNISKSFSLMFQPGFRYNQVSRSDIFDISKAYHQLTSATRDTFNIYFIDTTGQTTDIQRNYIYRNFYDSIIAGNKLKTKNYWEIEIPILLKFNAATNFAVFGGLSLTFGNLIQIEEQRNTFSGLQRYDSLSFATVPITTPPPQLQPANSYFNYNTPDISTATSNFHNPATNPARLGLMFGFSYELKEKILIDIMMKKNISDMKYIPNEEVRKIYTQPYFRIMLGVKIFDNNRNKEIKNPNGL